VVAVGELGDQSQLLALMLATRFARAQPAGRYGAFFVTLVAFFSRRSATRRSSRPRCSPSRRSGCWCYSVTSRWR